MWKIAAMTLLKLFICANGALPCKSRRGTMLRDSGNTTHSNKLKDAMSVSFDQNSYILTKIKE